MPTRLPGNLSAKRLITGLCLVIVFLAEFFAFDRQTSRHYAWVYPRWNDQIQYLTEVYRGYDIVAQEGIGPGLVKTATKPSAQGMLTAVGSVALFWVAGPSRSAGLALNMVGWIALQAAFFWLVYKVLKSPFLAWASLGILLLWNTPFFWGPGSAWDFRLDFIAACLFGITLAAAIATDGFATLGRSLLFGLCVGLMLLDRFLTGTYFLFIYVGFFVWLFFLAGTAKRLINWALSGVVVVCVAGPIFWINRQTVWEYYYMGHFAGPERAIRESHMGFFGSLEWVNSELFHSHLNSWFVSVALAISAVLGVVAWRRRAVARVEPMAPIGSRWWVPSALFLLAPALILTLHDEKSFVVVSVLVPPLFALAIGFWAWLSERAGLATRSGANRAIVAIVVALAVGTGAWRFVSSQLEPNYSPDFERDARALNHFADRISGMSKAAGLDSPRIAVDQVTDSMDAQVLRVICYERQHVWETFLMMLPTGIAAEKEDLLMQRIADSDFVILHADSSDGIYPFDHEMTQMLPRTTAWCKKNLTMIERFTLFGRTWVLYVRPAVAAKSGLK